MKGILLVDKPAGMTSFDVVARLRKIFNLRRIGHSGTLDPNATGLLIILLDKSTKLLPFIETKDKTYTFGMRLGIKTDTGDIWGKVREEVPSNDFSDPELTAVFSSFIGSYSQLPPMVSAIKIDGRKLYEYARMEQEVARPKREVTVYDLRYDGRQGHDIMGTVTCSKGTYVRTLCEDIAERLGTVGTMTQLRRTRIGRFDLNSAYTLEAIAAGDFELLTAQQLLDDYPCIVYPDTADIYNGRPLRLTTAEQTVAISDGSDVLAIYRRGADGVFYCERGLW